MQKDSKFFDDFAKLASGTAGTFMDMKRELEAIMMDKTEKLLSRMKLVGREEFNLMQAMIEQTRLKQEEIIKKLAELEKSLESHNTHSHSESKPSKK